MPQCSRRNRSVSPLALPFMPVIQLPGSPGPSFVRPRPPLGLPRLSPHCHTSQGPLWTGASWSAGPDLGPCLAPVPVCPRDLSLLPASLCSRGSASLVTSPRPPGTARWGPCCEDASPAKSSLDGASAPLPGRGLLCAQPGRGIAGSTGKMRLSAAVSPWARPFILLIVLSSSWREAGSRRGAAAESGLWNALLHGRLGLEVQPTWRWDGQMLCHFIKLPLRTGEAPPLSLLWGLDGRKKSIFLLFIKT